ncbi:hypothetical protein TeGR_g11882, partial [Tetraparma gracilis]
PSPSPSPSPAPPSGAKPSVPPRPARAKPARAKIKETEVFPGASSGGGEGGARAYGARKRSMALNSRALVPDVSSVMQATFRIKTIEGDPLACVVGTLLRAMGLNYSYDLGKFQEINGGDYLPIMAMCPGAPAPFLCVTPNTATLNGRALGAGDDDDGTRAQPVSQPFVVGGIHHIVCFLNQLRADAGYKLSE